MPPTRPPEFLGRKQPHGREHRPRPSSGLRGIAKNLLAGTSSHLVNVLQQVALTPLFLHTWGIAGFGQWLTLSASVSYLGTLDFGIQTFVNQDLTLRYHRGDLQNFHLHQSTALRLLLGSRHRRRRPRHPHPHSSPQNNGST